MDVICPRIGLVICSPFVYKVICVEILANGSLVLKLACISNICSHQDTHSKFMFSEGFDFRIHKEVPFLTNRIQKTCQIVHKVYLQNACSTSCSVHGIRLKVQPERQQVLVFHMLILSLDL